MITENPEVKETIRKQYLSMKKSGEVEAFIQNPDFLKQLKVFINQQPKHLMTIYTFDQDIVYIGSDVLTNTEVSN